jgi:hypothetical protein
LAGKVGFLYGARGQEKGGGAGVCRTAVCPGTVPHDFHSHLCRPLCTCQPITHHSCLGKTNGRNDGTTCPLERVAGCQFNSGTLKCMCASQLCGCQGLGIHHRGGTGSNCGRCAEGASWCHAHTQLSFKFSGCHHESRAVMSCF